MKRISASLLITFLSAAFLSALTSVASRGHVHHSPDGGTTAWYPPECCHDGDCHPVSEVRQSTLGLWMRTEDGITVLTNARQTHRPSPDNRWHVCVYFDELNQPAVLCIFEPGIV